MWVFIKAIANKYVKNNGYNITRSEDNRIQETTKVQYVLEGVADEEIMGAIKFKLATMRK